MYSHLLKENSTFSPDAINNIAEFIICEREFINHKQEIRTKTIEALKNEFLGKKINQWKKITGFLQNEFIDNETVLLINYQKDDNNYYWEKYKTKALLSINIKNCKCPSSFYADIVNVNFLAEKGGIFTEEMFKEKECSEPIQIPSKENLIEEITMFRDKSREICEMFDDKLNDYKYIGGVYSELLHELFRYSNLSSKIRY